MLKLLRLWEKIHLSKSFFVSMVWFSIFSHFSWFLHQSVSIWCKKCQIIMQLMFYKILHKSQNKKPSPFLKTYLIKNLNLQSTRIMKTPFMLLFEAPVDWYSNNFSFDGSIYCSRNNYCSNKRSNKRRL